MNEDVAGLVESLEAWGPLVAAGYEVPAASKAMHEAVSTIRALDAKLREAVEVIRAARRHNDNPRFYNSAIEDVTAAFLATMEQEDSTSE
jgi:hypothetical protein